MALSDKAKREIAAFDAHLDTSLQLNSSKVPAQEGVFSLIIGAGGTGVDALLEAKGMVNKTCCLDETHKDKPTNHVAYLAIDTDDEARQKNSSQRSGGAKLDTQKGELIQLSNPDMVRFLSPDYRHQVPSYISSWLDFSIGAHNGTDGAGGIRQCGRLLLFHNVDRIIQAIQGAVQQMIANQNVSHMNIYLLAGIGGGTGSGTFLDLAYIAQNVVSHLVGTGKTKSYGYLFMPDVNLSRPIPKENQACIQKNGYAALKELDYLMNMSKDGGKFTQRYTPTYIIDTETPPFDFIHLVSGKGKGGLILGDPYRHCMQAVAQSILSFVAQEKKEGVATEFAMKSHYDNIGAATAQFSSPYPERSNIYLALGTYDYELPIDQILLYVTSLLFDKMDSMFSCEPSQKDVDQARRVLGLTPGALIPMLVGNKCDLANGVDLKWEDLFGKNPKYNYQAKCQRWINDTTVHIHQQAEDFVRDFPAKFKQNCEAWFTNGTLGPVWVNHLIVNDKENCRGLLACLRRDAQTASGRVVELRKQMGTAQEYVAACERDARNAGALFGKRDGKTKAYIDALNAYGDVCAELVATQELCNAKETANIFGTCAQVMTEQNNKLFNVVTEVLMALKKVCKDNANILTNAKLDDSGHNFTWQPLSIPDVSPTIKKAFDASGTAQETIAKFSKALLENAQQWSENGVDVKSFIRKYLDDNLSSIANCSLETYVKDALQGADLQSSVTGILAPKIAQMSVPLMALSDENNVGATYTMLSVPYTCGGIKSAFKEYYAGKPDGGTSTVIQSSGINSRIFAQSLLSCVPLSAYDPLSQYEEIYLGPNGNAGLHLYMNKNDNKNAENWGDLPSPIPFRSRPKRAGAYPDAIKRVEDEQRELYRKCRDLPILQRDDSAVHTLFKLRLADMPNLDKDFAVERMQDERGRLDAARLEEAIRQLDTWKKQGLPKHVSTAADDPESYMVATVAAKTEDAETIAQESLLGEYNNLRRAREELAKYEALDKKREALAKLLEQTEGVARKANRVVVLLISGMVKMVRLEDGTPVYNYVAGTDEDGNPRERLLVKINRRMGIREVILSEAFEALATDSEPMKRNLHDRLLQKAEAAYRKMDAQKESLEEKVRKLKALNKGIQSRYEAVREDVMDNVADDGIDHETVAFYEKILGRLRREMRDAEDALKDFGDGGDDGFDEF